MSQSFDFQLIFAAVLAVGLYNLIAHLVLSAPRAVSLAVATIKLNARCGVAGRAVYAAAAREAVREIFRVALLPHSVVLVARNFRGSLTWTGVRPSRWLWNMEAHPELDTRPWSAPGARREIQSADYVPGVRGWHLDRRGVFHCHPAERDKAVVE